jgi:hypothetical protein
MIIKTTQNEQLVIFRNETEVDQVMEKEKTQACKLKLVKF